VVVVAGRGQVDARETADLVARLRQPVSARPAAVVREHLFLLLLIILYNFLPLNYNYVTPNFNKEINYTNFSIYN
jgi:hypothetical protein